MEDELEANEETSGEHSAVELILPTLEQQHSVREEDVQPLPSVHGNSLSFSDKSTHLELHGRCEELCGQTHSQGQTQNKPRNTSDADTDHSSEALVTLHAVTTIASDSDIFERSNVVFAIAGENQLLTVPCDEFHPTMQATTCSATKPVDRTPPTGNQVSEANLNQEKSVLENPSEPKKRRGGWPKGKKRKKDCVNMNKPKTPVAGYVRFINSRRADVKAQYPNLPSLQITKIIGAEWNTMSTAEKQVYHDEAEEDKKRYLEELVAYQQTEVYQQFLKRQQTKRLKDIGVENLEGLDPSFLTENFDEGEDGSLLHCKLCNQHFSSEHNKKEHMLGRQHLQMVTDEFEKEAVTKSKPVATQPSEKAQDELEGTSAEISEPAKLNTLSDVMETLLQHNYDREMEIRELRKTLSNSENQRLLLCKELDLIKKRISEAEQSLNSSKSLGVTLSNQLEELRVVPSLFGVMLQLQKNENSV